jgi:hypothetical protein
MLTVVLKAIKMLRKTTPTKTKYKDLFPSPRLTHDRESLYRGRKDQ